MEKNFVQEARSFATREINDVVPCMKLEARSSLWRATGASPRLRTEEPGASCLQVMATAKSALAQVEPNACAIFLLLLVPHGPLACFQWVMGHPHTIWWPTPSLETG